MDYFPAFLLTPFMLSHWLDGIFRQDKPYES